MNSGMGFFERQIGKLLILFTFVVMVSSFGVVMLLLPPESTFERAYGSGHLAKVMFVHVPFAVVSFLAFVIAASYGATYLRRRDVRFDLLSCASAEVGLLYAFVATLTGAVWAKYAWGTFWNWDPRQVTMVIVLSAYCAYFALRSAVEGEQRAIVSSAYSVVAAFATFVNYFVLLNWLPSLHPQRVILSRGSMGADYRFVLLLSIVAHSLLCVCLIRLCASCKWLEHKLLMLRTRGGLND